MRNLLILLFALATLAAAPPVSAQATELGEATIIPPADVESDVLIWCLSKTKYQACTTKPICPEARFACTYESIRSYAQSLLDGNDDNIIDNSEYAEQAGNASTLGDLTPDDFAQVDRANVFSKMQLVSESVLTITANAVNWDAYNNSSATLTMTDDATITVGLGGVPLSSESGKATLRVTMDALDNFGLTFAAASGLTLNLDPGETPAFLNPSAGETTTYEFVFVGDQIEIARLQ